MPADRQQCTETIAALLRQTAEDHHAAYSATDGVDPDWSIWYAGRLLEEGSLEKHLQAKLLKSAMEPALRVALPYATPNLPDEVARDGVMHTWASYSRSLPGCSKGR